MDFRIPCQKFHKIMIRKYQIRKIVPKDQTIRSLLCTYQALACEQYPRDYLFNDFLGYQYDMQYNVALTSVGCYSLLTYTLTAVDPKYIDDPNYNYKSIEQAFLECIKPVVTKHGFDKELFLKAKEIATSNLLYQEENEARVATQNALNAYFKDTIRDFNPEGELEVLKQITCKDLYAYYLSCMEDETACYVVGDVEDKFMISNTSTLKPHFDHFFTERGTCESKIYYPKDTAQTYLEMIYDVHTYPVGKEFYAVSFLNYVFGGCANSKLFTLVREKYGLCYSISSTYLGASGVILVSAILNEADVELAILKIEEAYHMILSDINLDSIKQHFLSERKARNDYIQSYLNDAFMEYTFPLSIQTQDEEQLIASITQKDLEEAFEKMKLSLVYIYGGKSHA